MPWIKGQSGNPGGRPRIVAGIRRKAQNDSDEAYRVLLEAMRDEENKPSERISAAVKVLQLAGVPMSEDKTPEGEDKPESPEQSMSPEQLESIAAEGES